MSRTRSALALAALVGALALPTAASAATVEECQAQVTALQARTADASFLGRQADKAEANALAKLDGAATALAAGKSEGAVLKLTDFRTNIESLTAAGKLDAEDGAALVAGADSAIACVNSIGA